VEWREKFDKSASPNVLFPFLPFFILYISLRVPPLLFTPEQNEIHFYDLLETSREYSVHDEF
jgi:hypothetical protein